MQPVPATVTIGSSQLVPDSEQPTTNTNTNKPVRIEEVINASNAPHIPARVTSSGSEAILDPHEKRARANHQRVIALVQPPGGW